MALYISFRYRKFRKLKWLEERVLSASKDFRHKKLRDLVGYCLDYSSLTRHIKDVDLRVEVRQEVARLNKKYQKEMSNKYGKPKLKKKEEETE